MKGFYHVGPRENNVALPQTPILNLNIPGGQEGGTVLFPTGTVWGVKIKERMSRGGHEGGPWFQVLDQGPHEGAFINNR